MHALVDALARDELIKPDVTLALWSIRRKLEATLKIDKAPPPSPFEEDTQSFE
jgi:hypothetical protein